MFCDCKQGSLWISNKITPEGIIYNTGREHTPSSDCLNTVFGYRFHWECDHKDDKITDGKPLLIQKKQYEAKGVPSAGILQLPTDQVFALRCVCVRAVRPFPQQKVSKHSPIVAQKRKKKTVPPLFPSLFTKTSGDQPEEA